MKFKAGIENKAANGLESQINVRGGPSHRAAKS